MLQQVMTAPGVIEFREVPTPAPKEGEILLKMERIGVCGSDIHVYHGKHPFTSYPVTQGHEVSATVVETGKNAQGFQPGQLVTVEPQLTCGVCHPCRHGKYNLCENLKVMGFQSTGLASEYFSVSADKVTPLPETLTADEGAMIEPLAVAVHAVKRMGEIKDRDIIVIGAGPIGNLTAQTAMGLGAKRVAITDVSDIRLQYAKDCGIPYCVNTLDNDFDAAMNGIFGADKADAIFDCAGNNHTIGQAVSYARKGSAIVLVAVFADMAQVDLAVLNDHELDLNTSMMYRHGDYVEAIRLVSENKVRLSPLISAHFPFREYLSAYEYIDKNRETTMKVIIDL